MLLLSKRVALLTYGLSLCVSHIVDLNIIKIYVVEILPSAGQCCNINRYSTGVHNLQIFFYPKYVHFIVRH